MTSGRQRLIWGMVAILGNALILAVKWYAYRITGSTALKSDAIESIVNVVASAFALSAVIYAEKPADSDHPYGHGKLEFFSSVFEGGLVTFAAIVIGYESVLAILSGPELRELNRGLWVSAGAGLLCAGLGLLLRSVGRRLRSVAIESDGIHVLSDFWTTAGTVVGLGIVKATGWTWADPVIGLLVALFLVRAGIKIVGSASAALLDAYDPMLVAQVVGSMKRELSPEIIAVHELRVMRSGRHIHVDVHLVVPEFLSTRDSHDRVERFCAQTLKTMDVEGEFHPHVDPCMRMYCSVCSVADCPIRAHPFVSRPELTTRTAVLPGIPEPNSE